MLDRTARPGEEGAWSTAKGTRLTWPWKRGVGIHPTVVTRKRGKMYEVAGKFIDLAAEN